MGIKDNLNEANKNSEKLNKSSKERKKLLEQENQQLREQLRLQQESLDLSSSLVDSIKEVLGINTKRSTSDANLLKVNKEINNAILNQKTGLNDIASLNKQIAKNQTILSKSKATEASLEATISKEGKKKVDRATRAFTIAQNAQKELEKALSTTDENGKLDQKAIQDAIDKEAKASAIAEKIFEGSGGLEKQLIFSKLNSEELKKQNKLREEELKEQEKINRKLGIAGGILEGLSKIPIINNVVDFPSIMDKAKSATKKTESGVLGLIAGFKEMGKQAITGLLNPANLALGAITMLGKALLSADKQAGEFAKNMGISYQESLQIVGSAREIASEFKGIASKDVLAAQSSLNEYFGTSAEFSKDIAGQFAQIQKRTGLSNKALGMYSKLAIKSGKSIKATLVDVNKTVMAQNQQNKLALNVKDIQEGVAEASSAVKLQTRGSVKALANAVIEAKKLGTNLAQVEQISSSLLDFESSIQSELEAELLLGREINLEKARAFALQGKTGEVAKEVMKNSAIMNAFETDNVIAQEAAAKAIGLSRDQLADMILKQQEMQTLQKAFGSDVKNMSDAQAKYNELRAQGVSEEEAAKRIGDESLANQLESASMAERFEEVMLRVQDIFVAMAVPILGMVEGLMQMVGGAENLAKIITVIAGAYLLIKGTQIAMKTLQAGQLAFESAKATIMGTQAVAATTTNAMATFGLGTVIAVAAVATALGALAAMTLMDDGMIGPGGETIVSGPKGSIQLNKDDSMIVGTDLMGGNKQGGGENRNDAALIAKMDQLIAVNQQILSKSPVIEMGGNEVGQGINTAEREIQ